MKNTIYLICAIVSNTLFRYKPFSFHFGKPEECHTTYALGQALSYIFLLLICKSLFTSKSYKIWYIAYWCSISNFLDELLFDPLNLGWNEIFFAGFILVWTILRKNYGESIK